MDTRKSTENIAVVVIAVALAAVSWGALQATCAAVRVVDGVKKTAAAKIQDEHNHASLQFNYNQFNSVKRT